jgi:tetratricopeptide (TPR) repeat protein
MIAMEPISKVALGSLQRAAEKHLQAGRAQAAIDELDRASEDLSSFPDLFRLKGIARLLQGNSTEAKFIFDQLEGCFGDNPEFLNVYGVALRREKDLVKSKEIYERGLDIKPNEPALLSNYGNLLIDIGKNDEARDILNKALSIAPNHSDAVQNLARLDRTQVNSQSQHEPLNSENNLKNSINKVLYSNDDQAATDWLQLAASSQRDKNYTETVQFCKKSIDSRPDLSAAYQLAGEALLRLDNVQDAERLLLYSALIGEANADTLSNLGGILATNGHCQLAVILLKRALSNQPQHQAAKQNLEHLESLIQSGKYKSKSII